MYCISRKIGEKCHLNKICSRSNFVSMNTVLNTEHQKDVAFKEKSMLNSISTSNLYNALNTPAMDRARTVLKRRQETPIQSDALKKKHLNEPSNSKEEETPDEFNKKNFESEDN